MFHTCCDTPSKLEVYEAYKSEYENLDFSLFDAYDNRDDWFVDSLQDDLRDQIKG